MDARALISLISGWADGDGPLYRRLAAAVSAAVARGDLPPGARLPAERALADALPASRGTVVSAFGLLVESGVVVRKQGSGTVVAGTPGADRPALAAGIRAQALTSRALHTRVGIGLGLSVLDDVGSLDSSAFEVDAVTLSRAGGRHGYAPLGIAPLRDRVAELLTARGFPTEMEEVAITLGAQHGLALAAEVLAVQGTRVAIEDPTYPGAIDVYSRAGLGFAALRSDRAGTDPASLHRAIAEGDVGIVHLAPQCASPTGVVTVGGRRSELASLIGDTDAWLVEDAALEFLAAPEGHGYLSADRPERAVLIGTTSKVFWGGLRVGWLRGPRAVIERLGRIRAAHDLGSSIAPQVTALRLLDDVDAVAADRRAVASARRTRLRTHLLDALPDASVALPDGGLSLWVSIARSDALVEAAAARGLDVLPGRVCSVSDRQGDRFRISAWASNEVLDRAATLLGEAWREIGSDDGREPSRRHP